MKSEEVGEGESINIMPPFIALKACIKIKDTTADLDASMT